MTTILNLEGKRFGRNVVISRAPKPEASYQTIWYCQCDCGSAIRTVREYLLVNGESKSCGCRDKGAGRKIKTYVGRRFNQFVVIKDNLKKKTGRKITCQCDCGSKPFTVGTANLRGTISCGCARFGKKKPRLIKTELKGKHFGRWHVLKKAEPKGYKPMWHCKCDCGTKREVAYWALIEGKSLSCGCLRSH